MKRIINLENVVRSAADLDYDHRFKHWTKEITAVDTTKTNGFAFEGDFVKAGDVEIEIKKRVYLVHSETGSTKYRHNSYVIVVLNPDGTATKTNIHTDDSTPGWALRIRDRVAELLKSNDEPATRPLVWTEVERALINMLFDMLDAEIAALVL
jgi:hypothetical protein